MKKLTFLLPLFCLALLYSCKKSETDPTPQKINQDLSINKLALSSTTVNQDTVPPSNAVNVKTYGAVGDGVHDDTQAIQNTINAQSSIVLKGGTYIINQTLTMRSGVRIYGTNGAIIKAGNSMGGRLLNQGMYFYLNSVSKAGVINIRFQPSARSYALSSWGNACINLFNAQMSDVKYNFFDFKQPYSANGIEGVWLSGNSTQNNYIGYNTLNTGGLVYENGASNNIMIRNVITNAHACAIGGYGNSTTFCTKNQVLNNTITNAGYMGITDTKNSDATYIAANIINGTGKSNKYTDAFAISAVGVNTVITLNNLTDAQNEYMEVGGNSKTVETNTINDTNGIADGIVVNLYGTANPYARIFTTIVNHNTINGCLHAIVVDGPNTPSVNITNNTINNPLNMGIDINSNSANYNVSIANNYIGLSKANNQARVAVATYAPNLTSGQKTSITGNTVQYQTSAAGGPSKEYAFLPRTNNVTLSSNKVLGNNIQTKMGAVIGISANASKFTNYIITNNTFTGVYVDITGFITTLLSGNIF